jgi:bifunctional DNase/RNase
MKRKQLKVMGLSYSQTQAGSYIVVLSEIKGSRKIPVVVKASDAQEIALKIEKIKSPRPLTHDLFKSLTDTFGIDVQEVFIHSLVEGIFYCKMIVNNGVEETEVECGIGDGITLALVYDCPIMIKTDVLDSAGISMNDDGTDAEIDEIEVEIDEKPKSKTKPKKRVVSVEDLEIMMHKALENEEYEIAASIRDRIKEQKGDN